MSPETFSQRLVFFSDATGSVSMGKRRTCHNEALCSSDDERTLKKQMKHKNGTPSDSCPNSNAVSYPCIQKRLGMRAKRILPSTDAPTSPINKHRRVSSGACQFPSPPPSSIGSFHASEETENDEGEKEDSNGNKNLMMVPYFFSNDPQCHDNSLEQSDSIRYAVCDRAMPKLLGDWRSNVDHEYPIIVYQPPEHAMLSSTFATSSKTSHSDKEQENGHKEEKRKQESSPILNSSSRCPAAYLDTSKPPVTSRPNALCEITLLDDDEDVVMDI